MIYQCLCGVEKAKNVALVVCRGKLPTRLNTILTDRALAAGTASVHVIVKTGADTFS